MKESNNKDITRLYKRLEKDAESSGYYLNPDVGFIKDLVKSLIFNDNRYGYWACPCRLASGSKDNDLDIICPCDYRDADLNEYGSCYCALYVSQEIKNGSRPPEPIPERRPNEEEREKMKNQKIKNLNIGFSKPIWRCKVCGYLCGRDEPPEVCPICKAKRERFERFK